ncbi:MAG: DAK2 domain-containing protein [Anaerolineae bacterium]|nr:DAK2 domain-containing protein [Anaerolineae bacterium]
MVDNKDSKLVVDGQGFKELVGAGLSWLRHHQEVVNALNVFPVPDGDTGTNMVLTMQSAWDEVAGSDEVHVGLVAHRVAHGALMGARGNSGVILSQIWRGLAHGMEGKSVVRGPDLAHALREGVDTAYRGVIRPVEGTILTVIREAAEEAELAAGQSEALLYVLERAVSRAEDAVARTPHMLAVLAEAGVVDAGGQGLFIILQGMLRCLKGEGVWNEVYTSRAVELAGAVHVHGEDEYGYDVQFIIIGKDMDVLAIREHIDGLGDCALVVGDESTIKVHVHVPDPGVPISYGASLGSLRDVVVEDMQAQSQEFSVARQGPPIVPKPLDVNEIASVVVAPGDGLARVFESLGAAVVIPGGQTMNPSTQEILHAIESVPNERVIVLPNNKNIIMAANQARDICKKQVVVVPTRTTPQGIAALLAFSQQVDLETNAQVMVRAMQDVRTGEVTVATRDVVLNGVQVHSGQVIGLLDDDLVTAGDSAAEVTRTLLERMDPAALEIVTLYYGSDVSSDAAEEFVEQLQDDYPDLEFEVLEGGQPHYFYIISAE